MNKKRIVLFASGEGTNAQNIIDHFRKGKVAEVALVVSNKPDAKVLERAKKAGIASLLIDRHSFYEQETVVDKLKAIGPDLIVLAGFLWMIPKNLIHAFPGRIINIHPALLPKFGGKGMYGINVHRAVLDAGEKETGISVHYVNDAYDEGEIIAQHTCKVVPGDSPEAIAKKVQQLEHEFFPRIIEGVLFKN
jgi:phosphoribosylglycinamide formyltransferase 1